MLGISRRGNERDVSASRDLFSKQSNSPHGLLMRTAGTQQWRCPSASDRRNKTLMLPRRFSAVASVSLSSDTSRAPLCNTNREGGTRVRGPHTHTEGLWPIGARRRSPLCGGERAGGGAICARVVGPHTRAPRHSRKHELETTALAAGGGHGASASENAAAPKDHLFGYMGGLREDRMPSLALRLLGWAREGLRSLASRLSEWPPRTCSSSARPRAPGTSSQSSPT